MLGARPEKVYRPSALVRTTRDGAPDSVTTTFGSGVPATSDTRPLMNAVFVTTSAQVVTAEVLPKGSVAVAVMNFLVSTGAEKLAEKVALPLPSVVVVVVPTNRSA